MRHAIVCATDLDRTLIYSAAAVARWGTTGPQATTVSRLRVVERYRDADASFMTGAAADGLVALTGRCHLVAVTTRTVEQLARVRLPGPPSQWAIAANGGVLLQDGTPDEFWRQVVADRLRTVAPLREVAADVQADCRPAWTRTLREAADMFCYAVLERAAVPAGFVEEQRERAARRGWKVSLQGNKLYWVPAPLTKSAAVAEVARRTQSGTVLAAGDSLLDADLLDAADAGIVARHGELPASGWGRSHVVVTDRCGVAAGEEVVGWFAEQLRARVTPGSPAVHGE